MIDELKYLCCGGGGEAWRGLADGGGGGAAGFQQFTRNYHEWPFPVLTRVPFSNESRGVRELAPVPNTPQGCR